MGLSDPAGIHFHSFWVARSDNVDLPLWLRIVSLAYGNHAKNGHATFFLKGESTLPGIFKREKQQIRNEIVRAVERGFLASSSNINCLVLPDEICGGASGSRYAKCKFHPHH